MMEPAAAASLLAATEEHVRQHMLGNDASHDWSHVDRVRSLAMRLAEQEGVTDVDTLLVVELAALLHDLHDYKYGGSDQEAGTAIRVRSHHFKLGVIACTGTGMSTVHAAAFALQGLLAEHGLPETLIQRVVDAVAAVSFHSELAASSGDAPRKLLTKEAAIVQDADRCAPRAAHSCHHHGSAVCCHEKRHIDPSSPRCHSAGLMQLVRSALLAA
jgi:uncharacterized protein